MQGPLALVSCPVSGLCTEILVPLCLLAAAGVAAGECPALPWVSLSTRLRLRLTPSPPKSLSEVPSALSSWKHTCVSRVLTPLHPQRLGFLSPLLPRLCSWLPVLSR